MPLVRRTPESSIISPAMALRRSNVPALSGKAGVAPPRKETNPALASKPPRALREKHGPGRLRNLTGELIDEFGWLRSWWRAER
jgi:hypothetical protein